MEETAGDRPRPKNQRRLVKVAALFFVVIIIIALPSWFLATAKREPEYAKIVTPTLRQQADFKLYYPSRLPQGYRGVEGSGKFTDNNTVFFYTLQRGQDKIVVSQQAVPDNNPPRLEDFPGFRKISVPSAQAVIGKTNDLGVVLILTNSTIITVKAESPNIPNNDLAAIAETMQAVE